MSDVINRFVPEVVFDTIGGDRVKRELDLNIFGMGERRKTYYPKNTKYVQLHDDVFVLQTVIGKLGKTVSKGRVLGKGALAKKLESPNADQSQQEFLKEFVIFLKSAGFTCIWKKWESVGNFETMQLINLNPDHIDFLDNGNINCVWKNEAYEVEKSDYIPFYDTVRGKDGKGKPVARPLKSQIENALDAQLGKAIQFEKTGVTVLSPKASGRSEKYDDGLDEIVIAKIPGSDGKVGKTHGELLEERFGEKGVSNRVIVSGIGVDATNLSSGLEKFDYSEKVEPDILAIYEAFGVPSELSPYGKNLTYENKQFAELEMTENECLPIANSLTKSLQLEFPNKGEVILDYSHLNCMSIVEERVQGTNAKTIEHLEKLADRNWINDQTAIRILKERKIIPE